MMAGAMLITSCTKDSGNTTNPGGSYTNTMTINGNGHNNELFQTASVVALGNVNAGGNGAISLQAGGPRSTNTSTNVTFSLIVDGITAGNYSLNPTDAVASITVGDGSTYQISPVSGTVNVAFGAVGATMSATFSDATFEYQNLATGVRDTVTASGSLSGKRNY